MSSNRWITITSDDGGEFRAYMTIPDGGKGPGVVLLQEIFGVNRHIRSIADKLADEGFTVVAPDLFWRLEPGFEVGYEGEDFERALAYYPKFNQELGLSDIGCTLKKLRSMPECTGRVGVMGFCLGGKLAYLCAVRLGFDVAVSYYGGGVQDHLDEASHLGCHLVIHLGETDDLIPPPAMAKIQETFEGDELADVYVYSGAEHGFNCDERASYHAEAAENAWARSLEALKSGLS